MASRMTSAGALLAAGVAFGGLAGCPAALAAQPAAVVTAGTCAVSSLRATVVTEPHNVVLGNVKAELVLVNTSKRSCTLKGYPDLNVLDGRGRREPIKTNWGSTYFIPDRGPVTVVLKPGDHRWAGLAWFMPNGDKSAVPAQLVITPPGQTGHLTIPFRPGRIEASSLDVTALR